jgi:hypothetical protein
MVLKHLTISPQEVAILFYAIYPHFSRPAGEISDKTVALVRS